MPDKFELATYLVNLHTLLTAQEQVGSIAKSRTIVDEYNANWEKLKQMITEGDKYETRTRR